MAEVNEWARQLENANGRKERLCAHCKHKFLKHGKDERKIGKRFIYNNCKNRNMYSNVKRL